MQMGCMRGCWRRGRRGEGPDLGWINCRVNGMESTALAVHAYAMRTIVECACDPDAISPLGGPGLSGHPEE